MSKCCLQRVLFRSAFERYRIFLSWDAAASSNCCNQLKRGAKRGRVSSARVRYWSSLTRWAVGAGCCNRRTRGAKRWGSDCSRVRRGGLVARGDGLCHVESCTGIAGVRSEGCSQQSEHHARRQKTLHVWRVSMKSHTQWLRQLSYHDARCISSEKYLTKFVLF